MTIQMKWTFSCELGVLCAMLLCLSGCKDKKRHRHIHLPRKGNPSAWSTAQYYEVLDAWIPLLPAETALAPTRLNQLPVFARLEKALGGGWQLKNNDRTSNR
jgi:hypothetical protein